VVLPLNILGISLIREGIDSDPIIYKIPAVME